jgi:hypothetical protein
MFYETYGPIAEMRKSPLLNEPVEFSRRVGLLSGII